MILFPTVSHSGIVFGSASISLNLSDSFLRVPVGYFNQNLEIISYPSVFQFPGFPSCWVTSSVDVGVQSCLGVKFVVFTDFFLDCSFADHIDFLHCSTSSSVGAELFPNLSLPNSW